MVSLKDDLLKLKSDMDTQYVSVFNDGTYCVDNGERIFDERNCKYSQDSDIRFYLKNVIRSLGNVDINYDNIDFDFKIGLVFKREELGENYEILPTSKPLDNMVRYYTENVHTYLGNDDCREFDISELQNRQGFLNYNLFVKQINEFGLTLNGPKSFVELKSMILNKDLFDIYTSLDFRQKEDKPLTLKRK